MSFRIPPPYHGPWIRRGFDWYLARLIKTDLEKVRVRNFPKSPLPELPLVIVANHTSWWDGFLMWDLQRKLRPDTAVYSVMLEIQRRRHWIFRKLGGVGIIPGDPGSVRGAFRWLANQRSSQLNVVYFPQGKIWPAFRRPLGFRSGVTLLSRLLAPCTILPVAIHAESLQCKRPTFFISLGQPREAGPCGIDHREIEIAVQNELNAIQSELSEFGEDIFDRWDRDPSQESLP